MTPTTTSGAADLPEALRLADLFELESDPESLYRLAAAELRRLHALAAGQATAAQQGVAYAALPDEGEPWRGHKFKEVQRGCWRCDCGKTIKEVTSDQSTPASGGNYPVMPKRYTVDDDGEELFTAEKMRAFADATCALRASHGQAPATQQAGIPGNFITHRAAWREALETAKFVSTGVDRSYWDHELAAFDRSFDQLWTLMQDAARKQGASHDR